MAIRPPRRRSAHSEQYGMSLPPGLTCGDCKHMARCRWLISAKPEDEVCDWSPSRFSPIPQP